MPEIHDPSGGSGFRARRRRKRKHMDDPAATTTTATAPSSIGPPPVASKVLDSLSAARRRPRIKTILKKKRTFFKPVVVDNTDVFAFEEEASTSPPPELAGNDKLPSLGASNTECTRKKSSLKTPPAQMTTAVVTEVKDGQQVNSLVAAENHFSANDCFVRQAIAVDTRHLDSPKGNEEYQQFTQRVMKFLQASCHRGMTPSCMAWTSAGTSDVKCESLSDQALGLTMKKVAPGTSVPTSVDGIPEEMTASKTWSLFGKMVAALVDHESSNQKKNEEKVPFCITILSSDASLLLEMNEERQNEVMELFLKDVEPFGDLLQAIRIVFVKGIAAIVSKDDTKDSMETDQALSSSQCNRNDAIDDLMETIFKMRSQKVSLLINHLQQRIETKMEEIFLQNRSQIQFDSKAVSRMDVTISAIDNKLGFHRLLQIWSQDVLTSRGQSTHQALKLKLPETAEFDACTITLQASYKILPFRLDSPMTTQLLSELEMLSLAKLEIVQLTPIDSIDASLLFGVAIELRAGVTDSTEEHTQHLMLLQSMFKTLASKDCALLLRATNQNESDSVASTARGVQYFVLMPELLGSTKGKPTANAVLHRIACEDYLVEEPTANDTQQALQNDDLIENPFEECVEASLETLECSPFNPLFFQAFDANDAHKTEWAPARSSTTTEHKKVTWKDDAFCNVETTEHKSHVKMCLAETFEKAVDLGTSNDKAKEEFSLWKDNSSVGSLLKDASEQEHEQQEQKPAQEYDIMECDSGSENVSKDEIWRDDSGVGSLMKKLEEEKNQTRKKQEELDQAGTTLSDNQNDTWNDDNEVGSLMKDVQEISSEKEAEVETAMDCDDETTEEEDESSKEYESPRKKSGSSEMSITEETTKTNEESESEDDIDSSSDDDDTTSSVKKPKRKPTEITIQRSSPDPQKKDSEAEWESSSSSGSDTESSDDSQLGKFQY